MQQNYILMTFWMSTLTHMVFTMNPITAMQVSDIGLNQSPAMVAV